MSPTRRQNPNLDQRASSQSTLKDKKCEVLFESLVIIDAIYFLSREPSAKSWKPSKNYLRTKICPVTIPLHLAL